MPYRLVWQLLGAARGLALHPTWRGPLGTLTNNADSTNTPNRGTLAAAAPAAPARGEAVQVDSIQTLLESAYGSST